MSTIILTFYAKLNIITSRRVLNKFSKIKIYNATISERRIL